MVLTVSQAAQNQQEAVEAIPTPNPQRNTSSHSIVLRWAVAALLITFQGSCSPPPSKRGKALPVIGERQRNEMMDHAYFAEASTDDIVDLPRRAIDLPDGALLLPVQGPNNEPVGLLIGADCITLFVGKQEFTLDACTLGDTTLHPNDTVLPGVKGKDILESVMGTQDSGIVFCSAFGCFELSNKAAQHIAHAARLPDEGKLATSIVIEEVPYAMTLTMSGAAIYHPANVIGAVPPLKGTCAITILPKVHDQAVPTDTEKHIAADSPGPDLTKEDP